MPGIGPICLKALGFRSDQDSFDAGLGFWDITPITKNQMEKNMENEMETLGPYKGVHRDIAPNNE